MFVSVSSLFINSECLLCRHTLSAVLKIKEHVGTFCELCAGKHVSGCVRGVLRTVSIRRSAVKGVGGFGEGVVSEFG